MLSLLSGSFFFLAFSFPLFRSLTLLAWVMGSLQGILRPLSTVLDLITLNYNHLPTDLSAPLDFKLREGRAVSVLFTALSPASGTAPST